MAEQRWRTIANGLKEHYELCEIAVHHRVGRVGSGSRRS